MKSWPLTCFLLALPLLPAVLAPARAQGDAPVPPAPSFFQQPPSTGFPVTGRMLCADTQRPARFALVTLLPASQDGGRRINARTDLDGAFTLPNVPPGDYYLTGALAGYVNQTTLIQNALNAGTDPGAVGAPLLHVTAGGASGILSLQRGGVLAGTVQWDDGSPAAGVNVSAQPATAANSSSGAAQLSQGARNGAGAFFGGGFAGAQTDDRGHFRLSGLAPGSYYLRANVQAPVPQRPDDRGFARTLSLSVYAPDKVRRSDATPITVGAGEERADFNIVLGLAGMHTVSGTVSSSTAPVRSGSANLADQADPTLNRIGTINSDGTFTIPYVPPGNYTLRISASTQAPSFGRGSGSNTSSLDTAAHFQPFSESLTVGDGDLTGLSVTVTTATASQ